MSTHAKPDIVDDSLVFIYDTDDGKSFKGEPTTNLQASGSAGVHASSSGNVVSVTDASAEKGAGWKKVTITARGTNFRTLQFTYTSMAANTMYSHSAVFDWGNMRDKGYVIYFDGNGTGSRAYYRAGDYSNTASESINSTMPDGKFAGTITHTSSHSHAFFVKNSTTGVSGLNDYFYYKEYQVEINTHPTQFTTGTRSATQGLLDRTGNETINLSDVSFNSNSEMIFDGTDDFIPLVDNPQNGENSVSWEFITKFDLVHDNETSTYRQLYIQESSVWIGQYYDYIGIDIAKDNGSWFDGNGGRVTSSKIGPVNSGEYYHVVFTWDGTNVKGYLNSELGFTTAISGLTGIRNGVTPRRIGRRSGNPLIGEMPIVKLYNRTLTAAEVLQNFNATKSRFGL